MDNLLKPKEGAVFYEDDKLYACLATYPKTKGHSVVAWKDNVKDLHLLSKEEYEHLMDVVDMVRNSIMKTLKVNKVYLMYMDEANHVHWHLIPRYKEKGYNLLEEDPKELEDLSLVSELKENLENLNQKNSSNTV